MSVKKAIQSINIICNPVYTYKEEGWDPTDTFLSGTEESVREWANHIKALGFDITVYYNGKPTNYKGVEYKSYLSYQPADKEINIKYSAFKHSDPSKVWYLTNEFDLAQKSWELQDFEGVILPSKWAMDNLGYHGNVKIVPHGYDKSLIYPEKKIKYQCFYASSPDRGLLDLLEMWPEIVERQPQATLIVTYGAPPTQTLPNVMFVGQLDDNDMNQLYRESDYWLYPCSSGELFCMTGIKAQVARAIPVYYPTQALGETVRHGIRADRFDFVDKTIEIMNDRHHQAVIRQKFAQEHYADWKDSTDILLHAIGAYNE